MSSAGRDVAAPGRSRACADDAHRVCGHVSFASPPVPEHRAESTIALCRCSCHRACPLARRREAVPVTVWQRRCACPGAEDARTKQGDPGESLPGFEEFRETFQRESRQRSEARTDALKAARRAAPGKTRNEIRTLYISELRARGLEIPPEPLLEAAIDMLSGDPRAGLRRIWKTALRTFTDG